ncbi:MAG: TetR family transcriptional regulator [Gemmatimonadales bacterium]|nr:TetR family transcriptional regulator [Gemmatimonadales bacterium]
MTKPAPAPRIGSDPVEAMLDAAGRLFRRKGYSATTIRDIAEAASVWPGSLHYRFRTKEAVLLALMERGIAIMESGFREAMATTDDPIAAIRQALRAHIARLVGNDHGTYVLLYETRQLEGEARERMTRLRDRYDALWDGLIRRALETDQLRSGLDVRLTRLFILGAVNWVPQWYSASGSLSPAEIADAFADRVLDGILRPKP